MSSRSALRQVRQCSHGAWLLALLLALILAMPPFGLAQESTTSEPSTTTTEQSEATGTDEGNIEKDSISVLESRAADPNAEDRPPLEDADATAVVLREKAADADRAAAEAERAAADAETLGDAEAAVAAAEVAIQARREAEAAATQAEAQEAVAEAVDEDSRDLETGLPIEVLDPSIDTEELELRLVPLTKDELAALAEIWFAIVREKTEEVMAAQVAILKTEGDVASAARDKLTDLTHVRKALFDKASKVASAWEKGWG